MGRAPLTDLSARKIAITRCTLHQRHAADGEGAGYLPRFAGPLLGGLFVEPEPTPPTVR